MTDEVRQIFVDKHNEYRSLIAKGLAVNKVGGFAPKAARMFKVIYDCDVEQTMANWAKTCQTWQAPSKDRNGYGQNRFSIRPIEPNKTIVAIKAVDNWFSQLAQIGVPQQNVLNLNVFYRGVWYYTQLAWQWSYKIGCAIQDCSSFTYAGCEYNPSGNILGSMIYEIGEPCKVDADCKCTGCTCSADEALCVQPSATTKKPTSDNSLTQDPIEVPVNYKAKWPAKPAHCNLDNGMTDEARQTFLDMHNAYRSMIAKGLAKDPLGGFAPKAARMMKMIYDCDVEQTMMEWAKTCQTWQAPSSARKGYGQNRFSIRPIEPNKTIVAEKAVNNWFSQLAQKGVPQENMLNLNVFYRGVWYYTQLAWQWSYQLGCAVVDCNGFTYAGCEYNPSGNFLGSMIYEIGEPCKTDADCKCEGCGCSPEEALCVPGVIPIKPVYWVPPEKIETHCDLDNGMTDELRQLWLNWHNQYRSLIAKGQAKNKTGYAPKAARMLKMSYDCDAEASVMSWIKNCIFKHNPGKDRPGYGQSLWSGSGSIFKANMTQLAVWSVHSWFNELASYGVSKDNILHFQGFEDIGHYTALAWQNSHRVGCGVVYCKGWVITGCEYNPPGDVFGALIYEMGDPCTTDADCKCTGCKCSIEEALCIPPPTNT
ncbi:SCP-like protein [Teladorsagia circumcincta]|uniref:SCP-like protein n=2 Tax=Teladorsagia circumcincta TaxID=45464 RepID=A0A2G9TDQ5_TELCI|nr:SCP-like protein [Teladorsagia circumcincta]